MTKTKEYQAWRDMKRRCNPLSDNPRNKWHIKKGITVCPQWANSFEQFVADMGNAPSPRHSLDRIDSNGNYEPSNCRWATSKEQANNRSGIRIKKITFNGITMNQSDWNKHLGFAHGVVNRRIRILGWSVEDALTKPKNYHFPKSHIHKK